MPAPKKTSKKTPKKTAAATAPDAPQVNTALAAASAATALVSRAKFGTVPASSAAQVDNIGDQAAESVAFKKIKEAANKPATPANMPFGNPAFNKQTSHTNAFGPRQPGYNQTQTGSTPRTGVPRRTAGG
jgi:hypothetical protein